MELVELSHNDDTASIANKCNINFKKMWFTLTKMTGRQTRSERDETNNAISSVVSNLITAVIPNAVTSQIAAQDIPRQISDAITQENIPQKIDNEISQRISDAYPEVGTYIISDNAPSYDDTTWQQVDTITTDSSVTIPVWKRTA